MLNSVENIKHDVRVLDMCVASQHSPRFSRTIARTLCKKGDQTLSFISKNQINLMKPTLISPIGFPHAILSTFHTVFSFYDHSNKIHEDQSMVN